MNWNDAERTCRCLASLAALDYPRFEVCVVDNGSADDGTALWRGSMPDVHVVRLDENRGYAGACNAGIAWLRRLGAEYGLFLNNDTTVASDALTVLVDQSLRLSDRALLAPKILMSAEPDRVWSAGGRLRWPWLEREHIGMSAGNLSHDVARSVDWASGCALFFPYRLPVDIGGMDERYFLYLEDVEWCLRARRRGYQVTFVPDARVWHDVSSSVRQTDSRLLRYYACRNYYLLVFQHAGPLGKAWVAGRLAITATKSALRLLLFPTYRRDSEYMAQMRALLDVALRRWGMAPYPHEKREAAASATRNVMG